LRVSARNELLLLRLAIAALLVFSFVRVTSPIASPTARAAQIVCHANLTRTAVVEAGARRAELSRSPILRFVETLVSSAPKPTALLISRENLLLQIWPEHFGTFFRRILPSTFDAAH
jgi:hypothetical protein